MGQLRHDRPVRHVDVLPDVLHPVLQLHPHLAVYDDRAASTARYGARFVADAQMWDARPSRTRARDQNMVGAPGLVLSACSRTSCRRDVQRDALPPRRRRRPVWGGRARRRGPRTAPTARRGPRRGAMRELRALVVGDTGGDDAVLAAAAAPALERGALRTRRDAAPPLARRGDASADRARVRDRDGRGHTVVVGDDDEAGGEDGDLPRRGRGRRGAEGPPARRRSRPCSRAIGAAAAGRRLASSASRPRSIGGGACSARSTSSANALPAARAPSAARASAGAAKAARATCRGGRARVDPVGTFGGKRDDGPRARAGARAAAARVRRASSRRLDRVRARRRRLLARADGRGLDAATISSLLQTAMLARAADLRTRGSTRLGGHVARGR